MKITNEFTVNTPIDRAWALLTDLEGIAPCMPGAQLTGVDGDVYKGKVKVKVGPVISEFAGTAQFTEKDDDAFRAVIDAKGRDARSAGNAAALVTAQLQPDGEKTLVSVDTDLKISGKLAQFGAGMIKEVSGKLLAQFVANLETKLAVDQDTAPPEPAPVAGESANGVAVGEPPATTASAAAVETAPGSAAVEPSAVEPSTVLSPASPTAATPATSPAASPAAGSAGSAPAVSGSAGSAPGGSTPGGSASAGSASGGSATVGSARNGSAPAGRASAGAASGIAGRAAFVPADEEPEALDLLSLAGGSIYKRLVPVAVGVVAVGAVIAWIVVRRR